MAEKQSVAGLGARPRKQLNALDNFTLAVKPEFKQKSLNEILADLSAAELEQLQKYGKMILSLSSPYSGSYYQQIHRMYKNLDRGKQLLLAELLQQIQPRDNTDGPEAEAMAARKLQADYMDRMIKDTAPKVKPKGPDLAGTSVDINALVSTFLKDVEKSKANKNSGRFDAYSEPVANADGQFSRKEDFVSLLKPIATKVAADLGIDPKIIMAQAILETGYGSAVKGKNYFGIKSHGRSGGIDVFTHESLGGKPVKMTDKFRSYDSLEDSVKDYGTFLKENKRYTPLLEADTLEDQLEAIGASGYATDPRYKKKLKGIIEGKTFNELLG